MNVMVKVFAAARDAVGADEVALEVPQGSTVGDVRTALCGAYPQIKPLVERALFAVDAQYAQDDEAIRADTEIACIPPVSGG